MKTLLPAALRPGDTIGLISPSSPSPDHEKIGRAVDYLEKLGYRVKPSRNFNRRTETRQELDRLKLLDIHEMFADRSVNAIFCLRGGSGATRLLSAVDYDLIAHNPKILAGYSDITALSQAILAKTGLITFSGPMLATELHAPSPFTEEHFWNMLCAPGALHGLVNHPDYPQKIFRTGRAEGTLTCGNLTVLSCLAGTPYFPQTGNGILLIEDVNEEPYRIDRLLSHLDNAGVLLSLGALLFGQFSRTAMHFLPDDPMTSIMQYYTAKTVPGTPVAGGISYGHIDHLLTIPVGATCRIEASPDALLLKTTAPVTC
ncbi:LD-carboxypeptidase [Prosthecochloris sp. HL-130-GSB]|uniref:LD-carboxypeptidase n=1 Tax=Prosthecochloris aestuarii TaxID=1102 RepID=A0A831SSX4_PROAE|nr:LD-carboxypeptidase [Prosthecochloris sp. HL-130-GSB]ARM30058.1 LD-carboxypeptidase [Prosthecochloris sp. HL-130-GSB]MBO8092332.1 LD-carboxypeptidase [Prosthecochloris sp.]HED31129.1 LD-carboxypeptidase [Prosthecochloris aestuarii]